MTVFAAALLLALQEPTLAENSRKVFSSMIDFTVENDRLTIRGTASKEEIEQLCEGVSSKLKVARGSCETPSGGGSWSGGSDKDESSAMVDFFQDAGRFTWSYVTSLARESMDFRQTHAGEVRLIFQGREYTTLFNQDKEGRCTLLVDNGKEALRWKADSFIALMASQGEALSKYVLAPLERYFDDAPLCPFSPLVIELALGAGPLDSDEAAFLKGLIGRCSDDNIEEREKAVADLSKFAGKNPRTRFAVGRGLDSAVEGETKARLGAVLKSIPRGLDSYRLVADQALYRDLDYLVRLLESGHPAKPRLEALTGHRWTTLEEWKTWIGQNRGKLNWNPDRWKFEP